MSSFVSSIVVPGFDFNRLRGGNDCIQIKSTTSSYFIADKNQHNWNHHCDVSRKSLPRGTTLMQVVPVYVVLTLPIATTISDGQIEYDFEIAPRTWVMDMSNKKGVYSRFSAPPCSSLFIKSGLFRKA
jgi:hypothetical protein